MKKSIVMLALPRHDEKFNSTTWQLATSFANKGHQVFYVDHAYTWTDFFKGFYRIELLKAFVQTFFPTWKIVGGVNVLPPVLFIPVNFLRFGRLYKVINRFNQFLLAKVINHKLIKQKTGAYHLINSFDFYLNEMHHLLKAPVQFIYHCIDPMIKPYTRKHGIRQELQIAKSADKVIITSPALAQKFVQQKKETYLVPNAANVDRCKQALLNETRADLIIGKMRKPILGYLGNIERRIDYDLLLGLAQQLQEWNIVLVGPKEDQYIPDAINDHPRIHLLPPVNQEDIPSVLKAFDVAMIPFKVDEVSSGIYPLKLFEYMAAGLPVVSTSFNMEILKSFDRDIVYLADTPEAMGQQVNEAFFVNQPPLIEKRVQIAELNSWEKRANDFLGILENNASCLVH